MRVHFQGPNNVCLKVIELVIGYICSGQFYFNWLGKIKIGTEWKECLHVLDMIKHLLMFHNQFIELEYKFITPVYWGQNQNVWLKIEIIKWKTNTLICFQI